MNDSNNQYQENPNYVNPNPSQNNSQGYNDTYYDNNYNSNNNQYGDTSTQEPKNNNGWWKIALIIVGIVVIAILLFTFLRGGTNNGEQAYAALTTKLCNAAIQYQEKNADVIDTNTPGATSYITLQTLADNYLIESVIKDPRYKTGLFSKNTTDQYIPLTAYVRLAVSSNGEVYCEGVVDTGDDTTKPVLTLKGGDEVAIAKGTNFEDPGATAVDDMDGDITDRITRSGTVDTTVVGDYTITYRVTDMSGNSTSKTRKVSVKELKDLDPTAAANIDTTAPIIQIKGYNPMCLVLGKKYVEPGVTAIDNVDGDITDRIVVDNKVTGERTGTFRVTYTATDTAGNIAVGYRSVQVATSCSASVPPKDTTPVNTAPTISLIGGAYVNWNINEAYIDRGATAWDKEDGDLTKYINVDASEVDVSKLGVYTVYYTVTDSKDLSTTVKRSITVVKPGTSAVTAHFLDTVSNLTYMVGDVHDIPIPRAQDSNGKSLTVAVKVKNPAGAIVSAIDFNTAGVYTMIYTATPTGGASQSISRLVTIKDNIAPILSAPKSIQVPKRTTSCSLTVQDLVNGGVTAIDNSDKNPVIKIKSGTVNTCTENKMAKDVVVYAVDGSGNVSKTATISVTVIMTFPTEVEEVQILNCGLAGFNLKVGGTMQLSALVLPITAKDKSVKWSAETSNVTVDSTGKVTAKAKGDATITATANNGKKATCKITVSDATTKPVTGVTIPECSAKKLTIKVGDSKLLKSAITPADASNRTVTWKTANSKIVSVNNGSITGIAEGTAKVTVTTNNGYYAECAITVTKAVVSTPQVQITGCETYGKGPRNAALSVGGKLTLGAKVTPDTLPLVDKVVTWTSTPNLVVDGNGNVTVAKNVTSGQGTVTVTTNKNTGNKTDHCTVTINNLAKKPVTGVTIPECNTTGLTIKTGTSKTLSATVSPADATDKSVKWATANSKIVTVDGSGKIQGIADGTAKITVTTNSEGKTAFCNITVSKTAPASDDTPPTKVVVTGNSNTNAKNPYNGNASWWGGNGKFITLTFNSSDPESGIKYFKIVDESGKVLANNIPTSTSNPNVGTYTWKSDINQTVYIIANNGIKDGPKSDGIILKQDNTGPATKLTNPLTADQWQKTASYTLKFTATDAGIGVDHYEYTFDDVKALKGNPKIEGTSKTGEEVFTEAKGKDYVYVRAVDKLGNADSTWANMTPSWLHMDTKAPNAPGINVAAQIGNKVAVGFTFSDSTDTNHPKSSGFGKYTYSLDAHAVQPINTQAGTFDITNGTAASATHSVTAWSYDKAGNQSAATTKAGINVLPALSVSCPKSSITQGTKIVCSLSGVSANEAGVKLECLNGSYSRSFTTISSDKTIYCIPSNVGTLTVKATKTGWSTGTSAPVTVTAKSGGGGTPTPTPSGPTIKECTSGRLTISSSSSDVTMKQFTYTPTSPSATWSSTGGSTGISLGSTGVLTVAKNAQGSITIKVNNSNGSDTCAITVNAPSAPTAKCTSGTVKNVVWLAAPTITGTCGTTTVRRNYSYDVCVNESWTHVASGSSNGVPTLGGIYYDSNGNGYESITWKVTLGTANPQTYTSDSVKHVCPNAVISCLYDGDSGSQRRYSCRSTTAGAQLSENNSTWKTSNEVFTMGTATIGATKTIYVKASGFSKDSVQICQFPKYNDSCSKEQRDTTVCAGTVEGKRTCNGINKRWVYDVFTHFDDNKAMCSGAPTTESAAVAKLGSVSSLACETYKKAYYWDGSTCEYRGVTVGCDYKWQ